MALTEHGLTGDSADSIRAATNGQTTLSAASNTLTDAMAGKDLICTRGTAQTLTIPTGLATQNFQAVVYVSGAGGITIQTDGTTTVSGNASVTQNNKVRISRSGATDTYICI